MQKKDIDQEIARAVAVMKEGGVILYPTDTIWGLGCDATDPVAVARIFRIKKRSDSKSLVLLASGLDQVALFVKEIPPMAIDLVEVNDRPMTLIYPEAKTWPAPGEGEEATVGSPVGSAKSRIVSKGIRIDAMSVHGLNFPDLNGFLSTIVPKTGSLIPSQI